MIAAWYSFENWPYIALALAALGLIIFVHELGHFVVAKMCGVKCEKFYIGFDPPIKVGWGKYSLPLPSALWKKKMGGNGIRDRYHPVGRLCKNAWPG